MTSLPHDRSPRPFFLIIPVVVAERVSSRSLHALFDLFSRKSLIGEVSPIRRWLNLLLSREPQSRILK